MTRLLAILSAVLAAVACGLTGAYVLRQFHTTAGLIGGLVLVLLAIAIALPVPFHAGVAALRENAVLIVPVIVDALIGGSRRTDPPADPPAAPKPPEAP